MLTHRSLAGLGSSRAAAFSSCLCRHRPLVSQAHLLQSATPGFRRPLFVASAYASPFASSLPSGPLQQQLVLVLFFGLRSWTPAIAATRLGLSSSDTRRLRSPRRCRRYGRPNYSDSHSNPDGSPKWVFLVGAGFTLPVGGTRNYASSILKLRGRRRPVTSARSSACSLQFDYDKMGMQTAALNKQLAPLQLLLLRRKLRLQRLGRQHPRPGHHAESHLHHSHRRNARRIRGDRRRLLSQVHPVHHDRPPEPAAIRTRWHSFTSALETLPSTGMHQQRGRREWWVRRHVEVLQCVPQPEIVLP